MMRSCICGIDREMHIPKLAREWRASSSSQSSTASSPTSSADSAESRSFTPAASIDFSAHAALEEDVEKDLIHEAFNERARKSLGIVSKVQPQFQPHYNEAVITPQVDLADWQGKLDGVEDGLLNFLSFADSWHSTPAASSTTTSTNLVANGKPDISFSTMSAQEEEARRQIEAYCRR